MPGGAKLAHSVVGDRLDRELGRRRQRCTVPHPEQAGRLPAPGLELLPQRLGSLGKVEVQAPVPEAGEGLVREGDQRPDTDPQVALDADDVEIPVVGESGGPCDRPVRPRSQDVADGSLAGVAPGARRICGVIHSIPGAHVGRVSRAGSGPSSYP